MTQDQGGLALGHPSSVACPGSEAEGVCRDLRLVEVKHLDILSVEDQQVGLLRERAW